MRGPLSQDDVEAAGGHHSPEGHRALAETVLGWAADPHPDDEVTPAELLVDAGWHLDLAGDTDAALAVFRRALEAGPTVPDARCSMAAVLLASERTAEAREVADELRRAKPPIATCSAMAGVFETAGDLDQAARWTAIGLARLELSTDFDVVDGEAELLLTTRARVRAAQGLPPDRPPVEPAP